MCVISQVVFDFCTLIITRCFKLICPRHIRRLTGNQPLKKPRYRDASLDEMSYLKVKVLIKLLQVCDTNVRVV